jgi:hypothetical protein
MTTNLYDWYVAGCLLGTGRPGAPMVYYVQRYIDDAEVERMFPGKERARGATPGLVESRRFNDDTAAEQHATELNCQLRLAHARFTYL